VLFGGSTTSLHFIKIITASKIPGRVNMETAQRYDVCFSNPFEESSPTKGIKSVVRTQYIAELLPSL
jgi:hypothetical protein